MGLLADYKQKSLQKKENVSLKHSPPEPHFCQPIAQSLSNVVRESTNLPFMPSSHYHPHDFGMADTNDILVIVGKSSAELVSIVNTTKLLRVWVDVCQSTNQAFLLLVRLTKQSYLMQGLQLKKIRVTGITLS